MTSYQTVIDMFYRRIEKDREFFLYVGLDGQQSMALARERAMGYLDESLAEIMLMCQPTVDFSDRDDAAAQFNFDLTPTEKLLISSLMYRQYLDRDISYLKTLSRDYTATDLRVFSPSEARDSFGKLYETVRAKCAELMDMYRNTDRGTGQYIGIDFDSYDTEE